MNEDIDKIIEGLEYFENIKEKVPKKELTR